MAMIDSATLHVPAVSRAAKAIAEFKAFWRAFFLRAFDPYRPELHYMRGPGPAWRAKHTTPSSH
ncbi:hypothetical protein JQ628_15920 [Bradyrhizobium lablabi]|uniref:hypothetical protein n=1 Tax=Bradyrhizobium lablabi TaxID=722472 RepID=UPI001BACB52A|nr:hypothetical protein [Bradyrhizobium lablabi]MBR1123014.1 hypothetical protein [Bradyrhizobium lablabi]